MVFEQTVEIPDSHWLAIEVPRNVPAGKAKITVTFETVDYSTRVLPVDTAFPAIEELKQQAAEKTARRKAEGKKPFEGLCGMLSDSPALAGDPVEMVRAWRDEWKTAR